MRNEEDLRAALSTLEQHAPRAATVLHDIGRQTARRRRRRASGLVAVAAGSAAVAVAVALTVSATPASAPTAARHTPKAGGAPKVALTARDILLTAAVNAAKAPAVGKYWVVSTKVMLLLGVGTSAHPYNIADYSTQQNWDPRSARLKGWIITKDDGARLATPADRAAWRLAGAPTSWKMGGGFSTSGSAAQAWSQPGGGTVGYLGGAVTAARLRALPRSEARLKAIMRKAARGGEGMFNVGVQLLQDPVRPQVRANVYRILAGLRRVRLTGITADPLGRSGRGVALPGNGTEQVIVISPGTGELLSDEFVVTTPGRRTGADGYLLSHQGCHVYQSIGLSKAAERKVAGGLTRAQCARFGFFGVEYPGQIQSYDAYTRLGWTNASPALPAEQLGPGDGKG
jgi:hypothetical protein